MTTLDEFDDMLDETHEMIVIAGGEYLPSYVLKTCDPIAYNVYASDWLSYCEQEKEHDS